MLDFVFTVPPPLGDVGLKRADLAVMSAASRPVSRAAVAACFSAGGVVEAANGRRIGKSEKLAPGVAVAVKGLEEPGDRIVRPEPLGALSVVWTSGDAVAVDKPAGQACHPLRPRETGSLAAALLARFPEMAGVGTDPMQPGIVHRIDTGTSGLVLAARNAAAYDSLRNQFSHRRVRKVYLALVSGTVSKAGGSSGFLIHEKGVHCKMRTALLRSIHRTERPLAAETFWTPLGTVPGGFTLLRVEIRTGVTHQIRCHLSEAGHPIVGDRIYGGVESRLAPRGGHCLHSFAAAFELPDGSSAAVNTPLPQWAVGVVSERGALPWS